MEVKDLVLIFQMLRKVYSRISLKEVYSMVKSVEVNSELLDDLILEKIQIAIK